MREDIAVRMGNISSFAITLATNSQNGQSVDLMRAQAMRIQAELIDVFVLLGNLQSAKG